MAFKKMAIKAPSFSLGIDSDSEDLLNRIVEDSLEKDGEVEQIQNVEGEVNSHHHVEGGERSFKHNFDLNEIPNESEGAAETDDVNEVLNPVEGAAEAELDLDLNKMPNVNVENEIEEELANHEKDEVQKNEKLKKWVHDMLKIYIAGFP
ncbi:hypothetical protein MTR_4g093530 [Medicago truncatula]|uniref:Uncharacterized protein n=1 Tax=Medicago truncatula TaxID=3880 RepID=G7JV33_MEDTR|nr:hypothetical protein MTR_4g093530 [Medicago truncatula]